MPTGIGSSEAGIGWQGVRTGESGLFSPSPERRSTKTALKSQPVVLLRGYSCCSPGLYLVLLVFLILPGFVPVSRTNIAASSFCFNDIIQYFLALHGRLAPACACHMQAKYGSGEKSKYNLCKVVEHACAAKVSVSSQGLRAPRQVRVLRTYGQHANRRTVEGAHHPVRLWRGIDPSQGELQASPERDISSGGLHPSQVSMRAQIASLSAIAQSC